MLPAQRDVIHLDPSPPMGAEERLFRAAYGIGADATQHEHRGRPFLTEDEAWDAWRAERAS